jgi:predicted RNase H-like HicB family nuclease
MKETHHPETDTGQWVKRLLDIGYAGAHAQGQAYEEIRRDIQEKRETWLADWKKFFGRE